MLGLYIHIPFCRKKCHYCNFVVTTAHAASVHGEFLTALETEMEFYRDSFNGKTFDTLYLGGGTPSTLTIDEMSRLFQLVNQNFKINPDAEITCEVNPGDMDSEKAIATRGFGVNRVSVGVQSFNPETLSRLNRDHGTGEIFSCFEILRKAGFENISLDLILSLPHETLSDVQNSLKNAVQLKPLHISLYELTIEEGTVFGQQSKRGKLAVTDENLQLQMLSRARDYLKNEGFDHYELLSYARQGFESRHNSIYWANEEYLGLGPAAFSYVQGKRFRGSRIVGEYFKKIKNNDWTAVEEECLDPEKKEIESFLLALRLSRGAERRRFAGVLQKMRKSLDDLRAKGLVEEAIDNIRLTERGQFFAETVFTELSLPI